MTDPFVPTIALPAEPSIQLVAETLHIDKVARTSGTVTVRTVVREESVKLTDSITRQHYETEHVPIGRVIEVAPDIRTEGDLTIIPVIEERVRLVRELVLVEELHMRRVTTSEPVELTATRRVMEAIVDRRDATNTLPA